MKNIAIINDIHGNLYLLNKALDYLKNRNISCYCFCGDFITDGPDSNEIIKTIKSLPSFTILGNREIAMFDYEKNPVESKPQFKPRFYTFKTLNKSTLEYFHNLSTYKILTIYGKKICISHGSPYNVRDTVYPKDQDILDKLIKDFNCDIYLFAHTHVNFSYIYKDRYFINSGAINEPIFMPLTTSFGILSIDNEKVTYQQINLKYKFKELLDYYIKSDYFKFNPEWTNIILYSCKSGYSYNEDFSKSYVPTLTYQQNFEKFMKHNKLTILKSTTTSNTINKK